MAAPLALVAARFEMPALFTVGMAALLVALALPTRPGQTPFEKIRGIFGHLPGVGWLRHGRSQGPAPDEPSS